LVDAQNGETESIKVVSIGLTETAFTMAPTLTAIPDEFKRIDAITGKALSETIVHMTAQDSSADVYELRGVGLYLEDGTLFGVYSQATPIFRKVSIAAFLLALDIAFANGTAGEIVFGDSSFLLPPATETIKGIAEIATSEEAAAGTDDSRIMTPLKVKQVLDALAAAIGMDVSAIEETLATLLARTITGGGLATGGGNLSENRTITVPGASSQEALAGTVSDKALTPLAMQAVLQSRGYTGGGLVTGGGDITVSRVLTVLAASAIEALDGGTIDRAITPGALLAVRQAISIIGAGLVSGGGDLTAARTLTVLAASAADIIAGTATDRAITPAALSGLARSLVVNGYAVLPGLGGLMLQWGRFSAASNSTSSTLFPIEFLTECFAVVPAGGASGGADSQDNPPVLVDGSITKSGFSVFSADDSAAYQRYIALGV
jgi:hypothetical protein